jgi:autophagy-related protein 2
LGSQPDFVGDDVPKDMEYLDASYGAAGGLRVLPDDDLDQFDEYVFRKASN